MRESLDLLDAGCLILRKVVLKRITVIEFGVNDGGGGKGGRSAVNEFDNSRTWNEMRSDQKR